jgi:omega-6 fatty acid desaturase (delta-12 desaturase)
MIFGGAAAMHHAGSGNLDRRGIGDIDMLTAGVPSAAPVAPALYRLYHHRW